MSQPDTAPEIDLDAGLEDAARLAAVAEWNGLAPARQAEVNFDELVRRHRRRLVRQRLRGSRPSPGEYCEVLAGPHAGLVGRVRVALPATAEQPARVRVTVQGGEHVVVPMADVQRV